MASALEVRALDRTPAVELNNAAFRSQSTDNAEGAQVDADGMNIHELESFLIETRDEPRWRKNADKCVDYYDNQQLDNDVLADMKERGIPPLIINLIMPTINTVLGMEAKARTDWRVDFDDEQFEDVAHALNKKLVEAERMTFADNAMSDAYAGQLKAGLGWIEVGRNPDPFEFPYRVSSVHRREIWWDWRKRDPKQWRYLIRKQWFDADQLIFAFPKMKDIIGYSMAKWGAWNFFAERLDDKTGLGQAFDIERAFTLEEQDWRDTERRRAIVFEVWYRKWIRGWVARLANGQAIELDVEKNPRHALAVATGAVQPFSAIYPQVRQAIYIGPHRVLDRKTPFPHRDFPYIPFFGFREDLSNTPYGLIRTMISPQDEINARRSKMLALMSSRRVQMDSDAVYEDYNTLEDVAEEASRHDSVIVTNPGRKNVGNKGVLIEDNRDLSAQQFEVLQESKNNIHDVSGVFPPMAGDSRGGLSGIAVNALVEQGTQTLAEVNDNYTFSRRKVGEQLLELIKADSLHPHTVALGEGKSKRVIHLNSSQPLVDEQLPEGETEGTANDVAGAQLKVVLEDVPSTPTYRQQQLAQLTEVTKSLPPNMQQFVIDFVIEATDLPDRKKIAQRIRTALNIPDPGAKDQGNQQQNQQLQQLQQEHQQQVAQLSDTLKKALDELQVMKVAKASKEAEVAVKGKEAETHAAAAQAKAENDRLRTLGEVVRDEFPKGGGADNAPDLEGAIGEILATVREGFREMHGRVGAIESKIKPGAPPAP